MVFIHGGGFVVHSADAYGITGTCKSVDGFLFKFITINESVSLRQKMSLFSGTCAAMTSSSSLFSIVSAYSASSALGIRFVPAISVFGIRPRV
jgi:hypothetical protein